METIIAFNLAARLRCGMSGPKTEEFLTRLRSAVKEFPAGSLFTVEIV